jgi:hypothetical protein
MYEEKAKKLNLCELEYGQIVWSEYFNCYVEYAGRDFDEDFCFRFLHKDGYCIIYSSEIYEPSDLIKELL